MSREVFQEMRAICKKGCRIIVLLAAAVIIFRPDAAAAVTDRTVAVSGSATKPVTPGALLDDFSYAAPLNLWNCQTFVFGAAGGTCAASYPNDPAITHGGTGNSLQLTYNVASPQSYAGYSSQLGSSSLTSPTAYTVVSFYVKGAAGGEFFKIEMKNTGSNDNTNHAAVYVTDFLDGGVTTGWRQVTIPLQNFANISDWTSMKEFVITFENSQSAANGSAAGGTVYIDDIRFDNPSISVLRLDPYGDKVGISSLGGNMGSDGGTGSGSSSYSFTASDYSGYPNSLRINYNVAASGSYVFVYEIFGGGFDGNQKVPQNFAAYNNISFDIKGTSGGNPAGIKIELHDAASRPNGQPFYVIAKGDATRAITTSWKHVTLPFSYFKDWAGSALNSSLMTEMVFTLENGNSVDKTGAIYIDNVQLEK